MAAKRKNLKSGEPETKRTAGREKNQAESEKKRVAKWQRYTVKKHGQGVLGLRGVTAQGVLWQHTRVTYTCMGVGRLHVCTITPFMHDCMQKCVDQSWLNDAMHLLAALMTT